MFGPDVKGVKLNLPESGNGTPDILNEIRWNLDWMLAMQDDDGGVWHKQTSEQFCGFVMPEKDTLVSYAIGTGKEPFKSSCATATWPRWRPSRARLQAFSMPDYAAEVPARRAKRRSTGSEKHPNVTFRNPQGVGTGGYGDGNCGDEHLWAAAELWRTTRGDQYQRYFLEHYSDYRKTALENLHYLLGRTRSRYRSSRAWGTTRSAIRTIGRAAPIRTPSRGPACSPVVPTADARTRPCATCRNCPPTCLRRRRTWTIRSPTRRTRWRSTGTLRWCSCWPARWRRSERLQDRTGGVRNIRKARALHWNLAYPAIMKTYTFKVVVEPDEDALGNPAWHAYCPALESIGAATSGRTRDEALKNINQVIQMIVEESLEEGRPLPEGPAGDVEVAEVSQETPRIAVTV
jgi:predicted RNase H-like HicB family nuclease